MKPVSYHARAVSASDADKVRQVVREYLADRDSPCPTCGYNLRGLDSDKCPECGEPAALVIVADERRQREAESRADARRRFGPWWTHLPGASWLVAYLGVSLMKGPAGAGQHPRVPGWAMLATLAGTLLVMVCFGVARRSKLRSVAPGRLALVQIALFLPAVVVYLLWAL